jgi:hypothetical protein
VHFLTEIDPRAAVKGSRDPLGLQPIWTRFGRQVVGNLTTVTTSLRNFTTWMLGLHFAEELIASKKASEEERVNLFMKFEQLVAYSRYAAGTEERTERILGITRVKKRLDARERVMVSAAQQYHILSNQKTYGIWGLYSVAGAQSGLAERGSGRLSPTGREFVERYYLPKLKREYPRAEQEVRALIRGEREFLPRGRHKQLARALATVLSPKLSPKERNFYSKVLILADSEGDPTAGRQGELWRTIEAVNGKGNFGWGNDFDFTEMTEVMKRAETPELAEELEHIHTLEPLFGAAAHLFGFSLQRNDAELERVAKEVRGTWGTGLKHLRPKQIENLRPRVRDASDDKTVDRLVQMATSLHDGDYQTFITTATAQNAAVMADRGGAPWLSLNKGRIRVRLRAEQGVLPPRKELGALWTNSYFINSLKTVGATVTGKI